MNVHQNRTSARSCSFCGGAGYTPDHDTMTHLGEPTLRECECSALRAIARVMAPQVRSAPVSEVHLPIYHASGLTDIILRPGHRSRFVIVRGTQANINAVLKLVHVLGGWQLRDQILYVTDKELVDARHLSFNQDDYEDESPYAAGQTLLARTKLLIISTGVAQSKGAQAALLEAVQLRLQADTDCWIVSADETPLERSVSFSPELQVALGRFKAIRIGGEAAGVQIATGAVTVTTESKTSIAKYGGVCVKCGGSFEAGDKVAWTKSAGGQRVHPGCVQPLQPQQ